MASVGHLKRICKDAFSVAAAIQETCSSELLRGPGADFLRGVAFWSIRSSGLLGWFCVTGAALRVTWLHYLVAGAMLKTGGVEKSQNALVRGPPHSTFQFWRKSRRIASFLMLSTEKLRKSRWIVSFLTLSSSKIKEVSQNCSVFDVCKCKNWGSLAE